MICAVVSKTARADSRAMPCAAEPTAGSAERAEAVPNARANPIAATFVPLFTITRSTGYPGLHGHNVCISWPQQEWALRITDMLACPSSPGLERAVLRTPRADVSERGGPRLPDPGGQAASGEPARANRLGMRCLPRPNPISPSEAAACGTGFNSSLKGRHDTRQARPEWADVRPPSGRAKAQR